MQKRIKNRITTIILELIATLLFLLTAILTKIKTKHYIDQIQQLTPSISTLSSNFNLSSNISILEASLNKLDAIANKILFLNAFLFPLLIFVIFVVFYGLVWKLTTKSQYKKFLLYSALPFISFTLFSIFFTNFLLGVLTYNPLIRPLILSLIFLLLTIMLSYISTLTSFKRSLLSTIKNLNLRKLKQTIPSFILLLLANAFFLLSFLTLYVFILAGLPKLVPGLLTTVSIILMNFSRTHYIKKLNKTYR